MIFKMVAFFGFFLVSLGYLAFVYMVLENRRPLFLPSKTPPSSGGDDQGGGDSNGGDDGGIPWDDITLDLPPGVSLAPDHDPKPAPVAQD